MSPHFQLLTTLVPQPRQEALVEAVLPSSVGGDEVHVINGEDEQIIKTLEWAAVAGSQDIPMISEVEQEVVVGIVALGGKITTSHSAIVIPL